MFLPSFIFLSNTGISVNNHQVLIVSASIIIVNIVAYKLWQGRITKKYKANSEETRNELLRLIQNNSMNAIHNVKDLGFKLEYKPDQLDPEQFIAYWENISESFSLCVKTTHIVATPKSKLMNIKVEIHPSAQDIAAGNSSIQYFFYIKPIGHNNAKNAEGYWYKLSSIDAINE